jgi:putative ABC transport system permease protein
MASAEMYLAVRRAKLDGGETNVPIRGVEPMSITLCGPELRIIEGRHFNPGDDEVIVGKNLTTRIQACQVGEVLRLNSTPFKVVGIFEMTGPFQSEIWGDARRMSKALERPGFNRVIARLRDPSPEAFAALAARLENDPRTPAKVQSERDYLTSQTAVLSGILFVLSGILGSVMGAAAILTGMNTMFTALAARSHEIGILISLGFRPIAVFFSFVFESFLIGLLGGAVGIVMVLPLNGLATGTTNFQTFTEVAFAFRITPSVLGSATAFAMLLGILGGGAHPLVL